MMIIGSVIEGIASRKDKTVRLTIGTQEMSPDKAAQLFGMNQQFCYLAIKKEDFNPSEVDTIESLKTDMENQKTPSQRLRAILYRNYEQASEGYQDFATYYQAKMEKICDHFKSKLT
jgi:isopentenyldiphosphate isomerase